MQKRTIILLITILIGIFIVGFIMLSNGSEKINVTDENITMKIKEDTLTNKGATLIITDLSGRDITYGKWYRLDKYVDGKWKKLNYIIKGPVAWLTMGYLTNDNNILEMDVNWEHLYGVLETGKYRIVKRADKKKIFTEFEID